MGRYAFQGDGEVFIETGTYRGDSLAEAAKQFPFCHSIEWDEGLFREAVARFRDHPRVKVYRGSSPDFLPLLCDGRKRTVFWLDAHYMAALPGQDMHDPACGQCPLLAEIAAIRQVRWENGATILIDDAHVLRESFWSAPVAADGSIRVDGYTSRRLGLKREEWPTWEQVDAALAGCLVSCDGTVLKAEIL